ncbi:putative zinc finger protein 66 [Stomoxys calcitrans]|uniref:putative zinc finger protein 66 n=1 Tax=Stomoxys calcitrans TaxID=35570 RepID=UPI0027E2A74E|nr:putative zinc finger protein 66 [Stomoxys calcitrans]
MASATICRLCLNMCNDIQRKLYESGERTEIYFMTAKYFEAELLKTENKDINGCNIVCDECWYHISEFHTFQESIVEKQKQVSSTRISDGTFVTSEALEISEEFIKCKSPTNEVIRPLEKPRMNLNLRNPPILFQTQNETYIAAPYQQVEDNDVCNLNNTTTYSQPQFSMAVKSEKEESSHFMATELGASDIGEDLRFDLNTPKAIEKCEPSMNEYLAINAALESESKMSIVEAGQPDVYNAAMQNDSRDSFTDSEYDKPFGLLEPGEFGATASNYSSKDEFPLTEYTQRLKEEDNGKKIKHDNEQTYTTTKTAMDYDTSSTDSESNRPQVPEEAEEESEAEPDYKARRKYKRKKNYSYKTNLKLLQTAEEYDAYIAKWRPVLTCEICPEECSTFSLLLQHFQQQHPNEKCHITCCQLKLYYRYEIEKHILYHTAPGAFKCEVCFNVFTTRYSLMVHIQANHAGHRFKCPNCPKSFAYFESLAYHKQKQNCKTAKTTTPENKPHVCNICGRSYKSKTNLNAHIRSTHSTNRKTFNCNVCDKIFYTTYAFKGHMSKHSGERSFACEYCPKNYFANNYLSAHIKKYHPEIWEQRQKGRVEKMSGEKHHKCPSCAKVFQSYWFYKDHLRAMHSDQPYVKCTLCSKEYRYSGNLAVHFKSAHYEEWKKKNKVTT